MKRLTLSLAVSFALLCSGAQAVPVAAPTQELAAMTLAIDAARSIVTPLPGVENPATFDLITRIEDVLGHKLPMGPPAPGEFVLKPYAEHRIAELVKSTDPIAQFALSGWRACQDDLTAIGLAAREAYLAAIQVAAANTANPGASAYLARVEMLLSQRLPAATAPRDLVGLRVAAIHAIYAVPIDQLQVLLTGPVYTVTLK